MKTGAIRLHQRPPGDTRDDENDAFVSVVPRRLYDGLCEAIRLTCEELPEQLPRFREVVQDILARADAWALTRDLVVESDECDGETPAAGQATGDAPGLDTQAADQRAPAEEPVASARGSYANAVTRTGFTMLLRGESQPVNEWLLIPFGEVEVERPLSGGSFQFTPAHAESAKQWFDRLGRKLAIDYEHQTFDAHNTRPDGLRPAAGWIGGLEVRDDGLWAIDVSWTDRAAELLQAGEYKYFSPVIFWTDDDLSDVAALGPVALTNDPAMRGVQPLAASKRPYLGDEAPSDDADIIPQRLLDELQTELSTLRKQIMARDADAFVEHGMRAGKILDSTSMDWRDDYLRDSKLTTERLERSPVLRPPGRILKLDARGEPLSGGGVERLSSRNSEICRRLGVEPEDLEAYERASAEGRVRVSSASG
jgi:hypothetical protein